MVRKISAFAIIALFTTGGDSFVPSTNIQRSATTTTSTKTTSSSSSSLDAAPTMVIYWTIKTAIDTIAYGLGVTDKVKGTGVWNAFELSREPEKEEAKKKNEEEEQDGN